MRPILERALHQYQTTKPFPNTFWVWVVLCATLIVLPSCEGRKNKCIDQKIDFSPVREAEHELRASAADAKKLEEENARLLEQTGGPK